MMPFKCGLRNDISDNGVCGGFITAGLALDVKSPNESCRPRVPISQQFSNRPSSLGGLDGAREGLKGEGASPEEA